jgi:NADPH:quinone reductase-like Zn-dependent oxidoreductase
MKTAMYKTLGSPTDVLDVIEVSARAPGPGEVQVDVLSAPIHNADILQIMGLYGTVPELPATPGGEAVGRVVAVGPGVNHLAVGTTVFIAGGSTWAQQVTGPAAAFMPLPAGDLDQLAMLVSSPATAHLLLQGYADLNEGDWVIQTAANSAVGSAVIQVAKARGLRTVNIVRRAEVVDDLKALGANIVLVGTDNLGERVAEATEGGHIKLALDAIGGPLIGLLVQTLGMGGTLVSYSQALEEPAAILPAALIFKQITLSGFWLSQWFAEASAADKQALFATLIPLVVSGQLKLPVDSTYPLDQLTDAVQRSMGGRRNGKVMLHPND